MQSEQPECPFENNVFHPDERPIEVSLSDCPYGDITHVEDEDGRIYCNACWDAKAPEWKGHDDTDTIIGA